MPKLTPQEAAKKHADRLKASTEDIRRGLSRVTEAPGVQAAAKQDKMRANLIASIDNGKWASRVASVTVEEWRKKAIEKGIPRIAAGIDGAHDKQVDFYGQLFDHQAGLQSKIEGMPDLTLEDNINRAVTFMRGMSTFKRK